MNHYPFHIGDHIKSTVHLTNEEDLTYRRLIDLYYDTEKPIGLDVEAVSQRIRCNVETVKKILAEFFSNTKAGYKNKRCNLEILQYYVKVKANRINGKLGGRPKKTQSVSKTQSVNLANPTITQTNLNQNQNQNQNHKPVNPPVASLPDWLDKEKWKAYIKLRSAKARTPESLKAAIEKLDGFRSVGHDPNQIVATSLANGWQGLFEPKVNGNGGNGAGPPWWASNEGIQAKARELGIESRKGESWNDLKTRISESLTTEQVTH